MHRIACKSVLLKINPLRNLIISTLISLSCQRIKKRIIIHIMGWPIFTLEIQICLIWANLKLFGATGASIALIIISYGIARVGVDVI